LRFFLDIQKIGRRFVEQNKTNVKLKKLNVMEKNLKNEIKNEMEVNMIEYLSNAKSETSIINEVLRPLTEVSEEQEQEIEAILEHTQQEWNNADCDAEGATKEQNIVLDKIIEDAAIAIAELF
jgi:hypothetical protein